MQQKIKEFFKNIAWKNIFTVLIFICIIILFFIFIQTGLNKQETKDTFRYEVRCINDMQFIYWETEKSSGLVQQFENYFEPKKCGEINEYSLCCISV